MSARGRQQLQGCVLSKRLSEALVSLLEDGKPGLLVLTLWLLFSLQYIHSAGIVHRVSPALVLMSVCWIETQLGREANEFQNVVSLTASSTLSPSGSPPLLPPVFGFVERLEEVRYFRRS